MAKRGWSMLVLAGLVLAGVCLARPETSAPVGPDAGQTCPFCKRAVQEDWQYCPWDGTGLKARRTELTVGEGPKGVVFRFHQAYAQRDREVLGACLDVEGMMTGLINRGMDRLEELTPEIRQLLKEKLTPTMSRATVEAVLDVMVSDAMHKEFAPPAEVSRNSIDLYYHEEIVGDTATLRPTRAADVAGRTEGIFVLKRKGNVWTITQLPGMTVR